MNVNVVVRFESTMTLEAWQNAVKRMGYNDPNEMNDITDYMTTDAMLDLWPFWEDLEESGIIRNIDFDNLSNSYSSDIEFVYGQYDSIFEFIFPCESELSITNIEKSMADFIKSYDFRLHSGENVEMTRLVVTEF